MSYVYSVQWWCTAHGTRNLLSSKLWYCGCWCWKKRKRIIYAWFALYLKIVWMRRFWFEYYFVFSFESSTVSKMCRTCTAYCTYFFFFFKIEEKRTRAEQKQKQKEVDYVYSGYEYDSYHHPSHSSTLFWVYYYFPILMMMIVTTLFRLYVSVQQHM